MKHTLLFFMAIIFSNSALKAQVEIKLYPKGPKESNEIAQPESFKRSDFLIDISNARMHYYPAPKETANGTAVLICPGGGYAGVSIIDEGESEAKWLNQMGVAAFVLYYRMPNGHSTIPLTDAQTALKIIHKNAKKWSIDKTKIGIMGFSAGGHLASTAATHFKNKKQRPAFMILGYPVVTMNMKLTHKGSRTNLLGKNPSEKLIKLFSNELQVTKKTPPAFMFHAKDDKVVGIINSTQLLNALKVNNVTAELHTFDVGGHGFGMKQRGLPADEWPDLLKIWMKRNNLIK